METIVWPLQHEESRELGCGWDVPGWTLEGSSPRQYQLHVLLDVTDFNSLLEGSYLRGFV